MNSQYEAGIKSDENVHIPIYIAGLAIGFLGLIAFVSTRGLDFFATLLLALLFMGFGVSWLVADGKMPVWIHGVIIGVVLVVTVMVMFTVDNTQSMFMNPDDVQSSDPRVATFLACFIVIYCFNLTTPKSIVFLCVPILSLIGLCSTLAASPEMIMCFVLFIGFACFILMQERALAGLSDECTPAALSTQASNRMSRRIAVSSGIALISLVIGGGLGSFFHNFVNTSLRPGAGIHGIAALMPGFASQDFASVASGPVPDNDTEVMTIAAPEGYLWRGQTYSEYNGKGWRSLPFHDDVRLREVDGEQRPSFDGYSGNTYRSDVGENDYVGRRNATREVTQIVHPVAGRFQVIFAAAEPKTITCNRSLGLTKVDGKISTRYSYSAESSFTIISEVSTATADQLSGASTNYPGTVRQRYLRTPKSCTEVKDLARRITKDEKTPYDKAVAIRNYLTENYSYDANTPATPDGEDPVPYFLFKSKIGYCDVFASSMTIMCRQLGIPARWATGFATGEYDPKDKKYHLRVQDYHAWVEVYFPEYGWIEFDPTPAGNESKPTDKLLAAFKRFKLQVQAEWPRYIMIFALTVLVAYLLKTELFDRYLKPRRRYGVNESRTSETYRMMCRMLARSGFPRYRTITPSEYASDLEEKFHLGLSHLSGSVKIITADFEEARYSNRELSEERIARGTALLNRLKNDLREARKQRLLPGGRSGLGN